MDWLSFWSGAIVGAVAGALVALATILWDDRRSEANLVAEAGPCEGDGCGICIGFGPGPASEPGDDGVDVA